MIEAPGCSVLFVNTLAGLVVRVVVLDVETGEVDVVAYDRRLADLKANGSRV